MSDSIPVASAVALVGPRDRPVDGVRDFCENLAPAMRRRGTALQVVEVGWRREGWRPSLRTLARQSQQWPGCWVLAQYTHVMWPWRGFPLGFLHMVRMLRRRNLRVAVVIHDPSPFPGVRPRDRARRLVQVWVMRQLVYLADAVVSTVPPHRLKWVRDEAARSRIAFIPVGSNIPVLRARPTSEHRMNGDLSRNIVVFGVTGDPTIAQEHTCREVEDIAHAVASAAQGGSSVRLTVVGRGSDQAAPLFRRALHHSRVSLDIAGLLSAEDLGKVLSEARALLFVRGHLSTRRTTAIAAMAYGVPLVGYAGQETDNRIVEAGTILVPSGDRNALAEKVELLLQDDRLWQDLHRRNLEAYARYFDWDVIARQYLDLLGVA